MTYPAPFDQPYYVILSLALGSHTITISDISVKEKDGAQELLTAQPGASWGQYIANDQGAAGTIAFENNIISYLYFYYHL